MRTIKVKILEQGPHIEAVKKELKLNRRNVIFANGCFDLIHAGHVKYLEEARLLGDVLIVGVNDDLSVRTLKGDQRPIMQLRDRMTVLAALECVDYVYPMNSTTNCDLMRLVEPNVWTKGGDYTIAQLDQGEKDVALELGIKVVILPLTPLLSTSALIDRIKG